MAVGLGTTVFVLDGSLTIIVVSGNALGYDFAVILFAHVTEPHMITEFLQTFTTHETVDTIVVVPTAPRADDTEPNTALRGSSSWRAIPNCGRDP